MTSEVLTTVEQAIRTVKAGRMIIIVDDEDRENEGDLMVAAEKTTPDIINFMAKYGRGLICLSLEKERLQGLNLPLMVSDNTARFDAVFGAVPRFVPMDARVRRFVPGRMSSGRAGMDIQTNAWVTPDGDQLYVGGASRPLMIPTAIDRYGCLDTGI